MTAFLNRKLDKPFYMTQPPGLRDSQNLNWVCKVDCPLYCLKQSPCSGTQKYAKYSSPRVWLSHNTIQPSTTVWWAKEMWGHWPFMLMILLWWDKTFLSVPPSSLLGITLKSPQTMSSITFYVLKLIVMFPGENVFLCQGNYIWEIASCFLTDGHHLR